MSTTKKAIHNTVSYNKVDLNRIVFDEIQENPRITSQKIGYVRYDDPKKGEYQFDIQTPEFKLDNYGIPDGPSSMFPTDKQRAFCKLPLDVREDIEDENEEELSDRKEKLVAFKELMIKLDTLISSKKEDFFGKKNASKYEYQPIVRCSQKVIDDEDDDSEEPVEKNEIFKPDFMKIKIPLDYNSDKVETEIYRKNKEGTDEFEEDGKYTKCEVESLDDLKQHVKYMRKQRFVLHLSKMWAAKQVTPGTNTKKFGATFKLVRVEVQQKAEPKKLADDANETPFIESDDDEEEVKEVQKLTLKDAEKEEEEESDESEEESEDLPPPPKKKTSRAKKV